MFLTESYRGAHVRPLDRQPRGGGPVRPRHRRRERQAPGRPENRRADGHHRRKRCNTRSRTILERHPAADQARQRPDRPPRLHVQPDQLRTPPRSPARSPQAKAPSPRSQSPSRSTNCATLKFTPTLDGHDRRAKPRKAERREPELQDRLPERRARHPVLVQRGEVHDPQAAPRRAHDDPESVPGRHLRNEPGGVPGRSRSSATRSSTPPSCRCRWKAPSTSSPTAARNSPKPCSSSTATASTSSCTAKRSSGQDRRHERDVPQHPGCPVRIDRSQHPDRALQRVRRQPPPRKPQLLRTETRRCRRFFKAQNGARDPPEHPRRRHRLPERQDQGPEARRRAEGLPQEARQEARRVRKGGAQSVRRKSTAGARRGRLTDGRGPSLFAPLGRAPPGVPLRRQGVEGQAAQGRTERGVR